MNSKEFFEKFKQLAEQGVEYYKSSPKFTEFIINGMRKMLEDEGYQTNCEYFRVDLIAWKAYDELDDKPSDMNHHFWDLEIAIEHENDSADWLDEVVKLAHIKCPLKVVIGYLPIGESHKKYLDYASKILRELKAMHNNNPNDEFALIIGNSRTESENQYFGYKLYLFDGKNFRE